MATKNEAGFTLVEIVLVLAIGSALAVIVFQGQRGLRAQSQFDADVNKIVSTVDDAHSEATAAVNSTTTGQGNGTKDCTGAAVAGGAYVFAGTGWSAIDAPAGATFRIDFYAANRTAAIPSSCIYDTRIISIPSAVRVNQAPGTGVAKSLFIRNDTGGINVCAVTAVATNVLTSFTAGSCTAGAVGNVALTLNLADSDGHKSTVQIDPSGLAQRIN